MKNQNNYPPVVQEIHAEFNTAASKLLVQAKKLIKKASGVDKEKISRLEKLGFTKAKQVSEGSSAIAGEKRAKENAERVLYFQSRYPNNKFIAEYQVEKICKKYNLVFGDVGKYLGFVPEKNIKEIESFELKKDDVVYKKEPNWATSWLMPSIKTDDNGRLVMDYDYEDRPKKESKKTPESLRICAPIKDMDMGDQTVVDGYKVEKVHVPDPVVLQPVKGGYLIVTAWGDEASDENVVNEKFN